MLNLRQLEYFYYVAKYGGFTRAARHVSFSIQQPALSLQVKALETDLEVKLYEIVGKRFRLTPSGEVLFGALGPFFESLGDVEAHLRGGAHGRLVVAEAAPMLILRGRGGLFARFRRRYPGVQLSLIERNWTHLLESIAQGEVHLALGSAPELLGNVSFEEWAETDYRLLFPAGHPLEKRPRPSLAELAAHPLVLLERGTADRQHIEDTFSRAKLAPRLAIESSSYGVINQAVAMGAGVAVVNGLWPRPEEAAGLRETVATHLFGKKRIGLFRRSGAYLPPYALEFLALLRKDAGAPPPAP